MDKEKIIEYSDKKEGESKNIIALPKKYIFEGKEYTEVDLSKMEKLRIRDAIEAQGKTTAATLIETSREYNMLLASKAAELPIEFFECMSYVGAAKVTRAVQEYIFGGKVEIKEDLKTLVLEHPYSYDGKEVTEVDLSGIVDLSLRDAIDAEQRLARNGQMSTTPETNYLYCCIIAAKATKISIDFFENLGIQEAAKLKNIISGFVFLE